MTKKQLLKNLTKEIKDLKAIINHYAKGNKNIRAELTKLQSRNCVLCDNIFLSDSELKSHLLEIHEMKKNVRSCDEPNIITEDDVNNMKQKDDERPLDMNTSIEVMYYCDKCDFEYEEEDAVESHKELYHDNNCDVCGDNFSEEDDLNIHKESVHSNKCDICEYESTSQKGLKIHKGVKHKLEASLDSEKINDLVAKDPFCPLQEQIAAHCVRCNLKFPNKSALNKHEKIMHAAALVF